MPPVTKIFGPPGTGKTTRLISIIEEAMRSGIKPERIAYVAFTRKAAHEAVTRAKAHFNLADDRFPYFRTLHSLAFRQLGIARDEVMQDEGYQELGRVLGFQFTTLDDASQMPIGTTLGDKVARIEALARVRQVSLETQWEDSNEHDCPWEAVKQWDEGVRRYKRARGFFDYTDLLEQYDTALDVDIFIVDEAQDLAPLQWAVVRKAAANAKHIYLAGDDDQAIYGWAGADVARFLRIKGERVILPQSYRIPRSVQDIAQSVVARINHRQAKDWSPRDIEGSVDWVRYEHSIDLTSNRTWLMLARNHSQLKRYEKLLIGEGYPYRIDGRHSTDIPATHALLAWEKGRKGGLLTPDEVNPMWLFLERGPLRVREDVLLSDLLPQEILAKTWMDALTGIPPQQREYLRSCLRNRESLVGEPRFSISTIHRSKGGEADHVVLIPDLSLKPWKALATDEEQRVLYVAVTRARERLTIVQPQSMRHYQI